MTYLILILAIFFEVFATTALKASDSFSRLLPSVITVVSYCVSFYLVSIVMRTMPTGIVYAIWAGLGIVLITVFGYLFAGEKLDFAACLGLALIVIGVMTINLFSKTVSH